MANAEIICDTLIEFLDRLALRRGRELYPQYSLHRLMLGFVDAETGEWFLVQQAHFVDTDLANESLKKSCDRFGKTPEEVIQLLSTPSGLKTLTKARK